MWSRRLVNSVCGRTGYVYTNQSLTEAANYASNTDQKASTDVRGGYDMEGLLNFVQLYCDAPHRHQSPYYKHPVSGILATNGVLHKNTNTAMVMRAQKYLEHFKDLGLKGSAVLTARVEGVLLYRGRDVPRTLHAHLLINKDRVAELVAEKPALIPFLSTADEDVRGFRKELVLTLCRGLERVMTQRTFSAGYDPCWQAFQLELALEEYHHGQPRTPLHKFQKPHQDEGILGLAPHTSASMGLSPPPLTIWTTNEIQQKRATQLFGLAGSLSANDAIIGRHMIRALLTDVGYGQAEKLLEYPELVDQIVTHHTYARFPQVFRLAYEMVVEAERDPGLALLEGLRSLGFKFFPLLRFRDFKGGKRIQWNARDFVEVREQGAPVSVATRAESLTEQIIQQLMARELSGQGHLEVFQTYGMPWLRALLTRMPREVTVEAKQMDIYVYVAFSQERLLQLQIRSTFELRTICRNTVLFKLHEDLPTRVQGAQLKRKRDTEDDAALNALLREAEHEPWHDLNSVQLLEEEEGERVERAPSMVVPVTVRTWWSAQEMECVPTGGSLQQDYQTYLRNCQREGIPVRSKKAFQRKHLAMTKDEQDQRPGTSTDM
ncbi:hypothetical protein WMY93_012987 [Mugilogobius chulae]|uniref:Uncharacterized protein n=1 Tax=Mugilogobius chulae TaxID=88201 RepID=A0AAW0P557_9GOBI